MSRQTSIRIDWELCDGRGLCAELVPELITLDEWGYPVVRPGSVPEDVLGHARRAAAACPTLALHLLKAPLPSPRPEPRPEPRPLPRP